MLKHPALKQYHVDSRIPNHTINYHMKTNCHFKAARFTHKSLQCTVGESAARLGQWKMTKLKHSLVRLFFVKFDQLLSLLYWPGLYTRIPWTERQNSHCIHGFRGQNARTLVASMDSVDRMPELSLRSRIPWTERQNSRCVHGFRGPNAGELSLRPRIS
jgi:hypothetical protein